MSAPVSPYTRLPDNRVRAALLMLCASLCFTVMNGSARLGCSRLPSFQVVFLRGLIDSLVILPLLLRAKTPLFGYHPKQLLIRGTIGTVGVSCIFFAVQRMPLAEAVSLFRTNVLFVPFVAWIFLREPIRPSILALTFLGFGGALLILRPGTEVFSGVGLVALVGAFANALTFTTIRHLTAKESPLSIMFSFLALSALYSVLIAGRDFLPLTSSEFAYILLIAMVGLLGQYLMTLAFAAAPAGVVTPWNSMEIVFSALFGAILLMQFPAPLSIIGMVTIAVSAILVSRRH